VRVPCKQNVGRYSSLQRSVCGVDYTLVAAGRWRERGVGGEGGRRSETAHCWQQVGGEVGGEGGGRGGKRGKGGQERESFQTSGMLACTAACGTVCRFNYRAVCSGAGQLLE